MKAIREDGHIKLHKIVEKRIPKSEDYLYTLACELNRDTVLEVDVLQDHGIYTEIRLITITSINCGMTTVKLSDEIDFSDLHKAVNLIGEELKCLE